MLDKVIDVKLGTNKGTFTDDKGVSHEYDVFTIMFKDLPVSVRVKPVDSTSKEILKVALGIKD